MASACGGVVFSSPTRFGISSIDSLPCRNLLRPSFHKDKLTPRSGQTYSASSCSRNKPTPRHLKLTPPVFNEAEWLPHLRHPRMLCSVARRRGGSRTLDLRARGGAEWSNTSVTGWCLKGMHAGLNMHLQGCPGATSADTACCDAPVL